jgi:hypothetical protein
MGFRTLDIDPAGNFVRTWHTMDISSQTLQAATITQYSDGYAIPTATYAAIALFLGGSSQGNLAIILNQGWLDRNQAINWTGNIDCGPGTSLASIIQTVANDTFRLAAWTADKPYRTPHAGQQNV